MRLRPAGLPHKSKVCAELLRDADDRDRKANLTRFDDGAEENPVDKVTGDPICSGFMNGSLGVVSKPTVVLVGDIDLINEIITAAPASLARSTALHFEPR